ncbi:alpha/beta hydrolase [Paraburkholderia phytofirmans]|uniref:alpha/beta hydrolase n=1 Tax=Paraburkholderia phytofirmans TaxID=261302 RepID=UPI0038BB4796
MPLDKATSAFVEQVAAARTRPISEMSPDEVRNGMVRMRPMFGTPPDVRRVEDVRVGDGADRFDIRVIVPEAEIQGIVIYLHGGGWTTGHIDDFDVFARKLATSSSCAVLMVNYRLAPEHRFPAALHDSDAALQWARQHGPSIAGRDVPIVLVGDSAGGNLAAVLARKARDREDPALAGVVLAYPATDADFTRASYVDPACQSLLTKETMAWYWSHYLPDVAERVNPDASPLRAGDLSRLPPTLIFTAEFDPLRDEGEEYAARLIRAGVNVEFERWTGQIHGFLTMVNILPASERALGKIAHFIRARVPQHHLTNA